MQHPRPVVTSLRLCEGRGDSQVGKAFNSCRTGGWREDPADDEGRRFQVLVQLAGPLGSAKGVVCCKPASVYQLPNRGEVRALSGRDNRN